MSSQVLLTETLQKQCVSPRKKQWLEWPIRNWLSCLAITIFLTGYNPIGCLTRTRTKVFLGKATTRKRFHNSASGTNRMAKVSQVSLFEPRYFVIITMLRFIWREHYYWFLCRDAFPTPEKYENQTLSPIGHLARLSRHRTWHEVLERNCEIISPTRLQFRNCHISTKSYASVEAPSRMDL